MDLSLNNFAGTIPTEIGNLRQLARLFLSHNTFSGPIPSTIPSEIGNLQQLTHLGLDGHTFLTGIVHHPFQTDTS
eukprot:scaffold12377_cov49-Cylindrotheca_fusiformis.AAC.1